MAKPLTVGERVTWINRDHGREKKMHGKLAEIRGTYADIDEEKTGKRVTTLLERCERARGRKPMGSEYLRA